jgi:hypothetical protein
MASLMELVEKVNKGEQVEPEQLEVYQDSPNSAEKFLAHHAHALLDLRRAHQHMLQSLEAIDYSDQKVLNQFVSVSGFLGLTDLRAQPVIKFGASAIARREYSLGLDALQIFSTAAPLPPTAKIVSSSRRNTIASRSASAGRRAAPVSGATSKPASA